MARTYVRLCVDLPQVLVHEDGGLVEVTTELSSKGGYVVNGVAVPRSTGCDVVAYTKAGTAHVTLVRYVRTTKALDYTTKPIEGSIRVVFSLFCRRGVPVSP